VNFAVYILVALGAYSLGSIPSGFLVGRARGIDIRQMGSGNIGATNVFRILGKKAGILVFCMDALKGFIACRTLPWLVSGLFPGPAGEPPVALEPLTVWAGLFVIVGHIYTLWLRFKGGKGVATTAGVLTALAPLAFLIAFGLWLVVLLATRYVSAASMTAAVFLPFIVWGTGGGKYHIALITVVSLLALIKHRSNYQRLRLGTESRFEWKKPTAKTQP
jgi:acyl phosphate:glycerol-3-phosphate acyltransferase